ncbi:MAG: branched-chain amino acid ABC transporter permease [Lautropia sp.]
MHRLELGLFAVLAVGVAIVPMFTSNQFYLNILIFIGIYSLLIIGLSLLFGFAGQISVAQAAFYGLGAYTSAILTLRYQWPTALAAVCAMAGPMAIAWIIGRPIMKLKHFYLAMATLALGNMFAVLFAEQRGLTGGFQGLAGIPPPSILGYSVETLSGYYYLVWILVGLVFLFSFNILRSRIGRALRAIHGSETAAAAMGVDVAGYKTWMFVLSAGYAGLAGSVYAHYVSFISPEAFQPHLSILLIVMLYIGGLRSLWGSLLGATFAIVIPELLSRYKGLDVLAYGAVLLIVMMLLPGGLASLVQRGAEAVLRRGRATAAAPAAAAPVAEEAGVTKPAVTPREATP